MTLTVAGPGRAAATFSRRMARIPGLQELLGVERLIYRPRAAEAAAIGVVVGWGEKANTVRSKAYAKRHDLPYWRVEDGFLRSVGLGVLGDPPLSVVVDDEGIYYDARAPSRLETLLASDGDGTDPLNDPAVLKRAARCMDQIREARLSKYNHAPPMAEPLASVDRQRVLVVDQTRGDLSVIGALASEDSFDAMLRAAQAEHPDAEILVKMHPDVVAGRKRGYLDSSRAKGRVTVMAELIPPLDLLAQVDHVYVVSSQLGFEALLAGKSVTCFGAPFYAGWGLTDDRVEVPRRGRARTLEQVFAAAYLLYPRYLDPDLKTACEAERVIEHLATQRAQFERNTGRIFCFGFRFWKRNYVRAYLRSPGNEVVFARDAKHAKELRFDEASRVLVWGQRETADVRALAAEYEVEVWRMEDGFLRSIGLGSDMVAPASLVVDREGIYYDPTRPSELESILETTAFGAEELDRAATLRKTIVASGLSKYNVGESSALDVPPGRHVILVPGQVEDDASIQLGCRSVNTNLGLLKEARAAHPDGFIIYKPHPDVLSGNRRGRVALDQAREVCDHVEEDASLSECLAVADEVHTLTSLVGFESLLRELRVVVYGQPFYSSWGLTEDRHPVERRTRALSLDELVAGTLIHYPRYLNDQTGQFTTPEVIVELLRARRDEGGQRLRVSWLRRQFRKLSHIYRGMTHAP